MVGDQGKALNQKQVGLLWDIDKFEGGVQVGETQLCPFYPSHPSQGAAFIRIYPHR